MTDSDHTEDLVLEDEQDDIPYVEYDISVSPSDLSLELLANKIDNADIIIPFYQRKYVWKIEQASKLIESFLMGLPVPQLFFYVNSEDQLEVIDGQQRLMSVKYFFEGYFGEEDKKGRRQIFKLKGLAERSDYNGKTFEKLSKRDQRKLRNSTLRAINIKQLSPHTARDRDGADCVFHIFERLNTGGTLLRPQEIRNAVYRGKLVDKLQELNGNTHWQSILGLSRPDKSQKDVELVLRLFSLFENVNKYEKPMLRHLNGFMEQHKNLDSAKAAKFESRFGPATKLVNSALTKPFRPRGVLNTAVLEAVMLTVLENPAFTVSKLKLGYKKLLEDEAFLQSITGGTTDTLVLHKRNSIARKVMKG